MEELNSQLDKKTETLANLKKSYDDLSEKLKSKEEKLQFFERNEKKNKSVFDEEATGVTGSETGDMVLANEKILQLLINFLLLKKY